MEKFGFVYLWYDVGTKRFYVGCHWGHEEDGYVCSSPSMREAYRRRKEDFKRRILSRIYTNRHDLLTEEQRFLDMIPREDFGTKFYNVNSKANFYAWWMNETTKAEVVAKINASNAVRGEKISKALKGKYVGELNSKYGVPRTEEWKQWFRDNHPRPCLGRKQDPKTVAKRVEGIKATWASQSQEQKDLISVERRSRKHSEETKNKMRDAAITRERKRRELRLLNIENAS